MLRTWTASLSRRARERLAAVIAVSLLAVAGSAPHAAASHSSSDARQTAAGVADRSAALLLPPPTSEPPEPEPDPPPTSEPPETPEPDPPPPPPPPPNLECDDPAGFARPTGTVPPGYVYSPTEFTGAIVDPQPDDTFAADSPGHAAHAGRLRTRVVGGREELLVCAHLGTNTPTDALTPFPLPGPGGHPATIAPRVVVIDASGGTNHYELGDPGIEGTLSHYVGSSDVHTGYLQMWVPFTPALREPGFVVRVEVRGASALPSGGTSQVMGADEVFVHLGPPPATRTGRIDQALGVAFDDSLIGERPEDPGADDLSSLIADDVEARIAERIELTAPRDIPGDWVWDPNSLASTKGGGRLHSLDTFVHSLALDVENFNETEGRAVVTFRGNARPKMTLKIRRAGVPSIIGGSCEVESLVSFEGRAAFTLNLDDSMSRLEADVGFIDIAPSVNWVSATGNLVALWGPLPTDLNCNSIEGDLHGGVAAQVDEQIQDIEDDTELLDDLEAQIADQLNADDPAEGPLSTRDVIVPGGLGFGVSSARYVPTAPTGHIGGEVLITNQGAHLAAGLLVSDQGGQRFGRSYVPSATSTVVSSTYGRSRLAGAGDFDLGLVVSGGTVNQLLRALTAGKPTANPGHPSTDVGLLDLTTGVDVDGNGTTDLDVTVHPSSAPMFLPQPPADWPAPGNLNVLVPSLRVSIPIPDIATMAADISVGLDATIDRTNHLVPTVQSTEVRPRFLRLGPSINQTTDPAEDPGGIVAFAAARLRDAIPDRVATMLRPVALPDLTTGDDLPQLHLANLTVGTIGGGHLGAQVDVLAGPPPSPPPTVITTWATATPNGPATSFTTEIRPTGLPGTGSYNLRWTVTDVNTGSVIYQSPAAGEPATTKTFLAAGLGPFVDPCTAERTVSVSVSAVVTRDDGTKTESGASQHTWQGPPVPDPPHFCFPEPEPEPEPDPDVPPICRRQPWKCPDEL